MTDQPSPSADHPRVLLDTTAIVGSGYGTSARFQHLLREAANDRITVLVPQLVLEESVMVFERELDGHRMAFERLPRLARAADVAMPDRASLTMLLRMRLSERLTSAGVRIVPSPAIDHDELVRRVLERRRPTKPLRRDKSGELEKDQPEGYRDQLLWATVLQAAAESQLVFLTDNTRDFGESGSRDGGRADLHHQLREDMAAAKLPADAITLVLNVDTFVDEYLTDTDVVAVVQGFLESGALGSLAEEVREYVDRAGIGVLNYLPDEALQSDIEDVWLTRLGEIEPRIHVDDAWIETDPGEDTSYGVAATMWGRGEVTWHVSAPTSWDLEAFAGMVESADAGGIIQGFEDAAPVEFSVSGSFIPSANGWDDVFVDIPRLVEAELKVRRDRRHSAADRLLDQNP